MTESGSGTATRAALRVAVVGAEGRMGQTACDAVVEAADLELVARFDVGDDLEAGLAVGAATRPDVLVDFSVPAAAPGHVGLAVAAGVHAVVGTTGWDADRLAAVERALAAAPDVGVLIAPNFSVGALLITDFAARAARFFESVEIVELHHPAKVDAPSGTAARTARLVAQAREAAGVPPAPDATSSALPGARGAVVDGIPVHAVRLRGLIAHQEVLLGGTGEVVTLRHDSLDRSAFMPGLLLAVREVGTHPGLTVGLEHWLDL